MKIVKFIIRTFALWLEQKTKYYVISKEMYDAKDYTSILNMCKEQREKYKGLVIELDYLRLETLTRLLISKRGK